MLISVMSPFEVEAASEDSLKELPDEIIDYGYTELITFKYKDQVVWNVFVDRFLYSRYETDSPH